MQTTTQRPLAFNKRAARAVGRFFVRLCGLGMSEVQEMEFELALLTGLLGNIRYRHNEAMWELTHRPNGDHEIEVAFHGGVRTRDELIQAVADARHEATRLQERSQELRRRVGAIRLQEQRDRSEMQGARAWNERLKIIEDLRRATTQAAMWLDALRDPPKPPTAS